MPRLIVYLILFVERFCWFLFGVVTRQLVYLIQRKKDRTHEDYQEHLDRQNDTDRAPTHAHPGIYPRLRATIILFAAVETLTPRVFATVA